ncbi:MAG: hypothetical protein K1X74_04620 [Pirellulales bacterium]|nr:hypothetical protein [Pirellulales bacterium]
MDAQSTVTTPVPQSSQRRRPRRWLARHAWWFAPLVLLAAMVLVLWIQLLRIDAQYRAVLVRLHAAGMPTNGAELNDFYRRPPAEQDATQAWLAALGAAKTADRSLSPALQRLLAQTADPDSPPDPPPADALGEPPVTEADLRAILQPALDAAYAAQDHGTQVRYPVDYREAFNSMSQQTLTFISARDLERMLNADANLQADAGDLDGAIRAIACGWALSQTFRHEATEIGQLVHVGMASMVQATALRLINHHPLSTDALNRLADKFGDAAWNESLVHGWQGEVAYMLDSIDVAPFAGQEFELARPLAPIYRLCMATYLERTIHVAQRPWPELLACGKAVDEEFERRHDRMFPPARIVHEPCVSGVWVFSNHAARMAQGFARTEGLLAAIAARQWIDEHGTPPESLEQLVPAFLAEVPVDPFTGTPLRLKVTDAEWIVYSISADGRDDGGRAERLNGELLPRDIPTVLKLAPAP